MVVELEDVAQVVARVGVVLDHQDVERRSRSSMGTQCGPFPLPRSSSAILARRSSVVEQGRDVERLVADRVGPLGDDLRDEPGPSPSGSP